MSHNDARHRVAPFPSRPLDTGQLDGKGADRTQASAEPLLQRIQRVTSGICQMGFSLPDIDGGEDSSG